jgi:hypothetical protein
MFLPFAGKKMPTRSNFYRFAVNTNDFADFFAGKIMPTKAANNRACSCAGKILHAHLSILWKINSSCKGVPLQIEPWSRGKFYRRGSQGVIFFCRRGFLPTNCRLALRLCSGMCARAKSRAKIKFCRRNDFAAEAQHFFCRRHFRG